MKTKQGGFTLIEIAIVLVIIGLLLGGILKGQELINSAKVKNLANDFRTIPLFIYGYQDKFRSLPGDDKDVATHLGAGATLATTPAGSVGNGVIDGAWNSTTQTDESYLFWQHVRLAGFGAGSTQLGADYLPTNAEGGQIGIQSGTSTAANAPIVDLSTPPIAIRGSYVICSRSILGKYVLQLDQQLDNGDSASGAMMATPVSGYAIGAAATAKASIDPSASYIVCMGV